MCITATHKITRKENLRKSVNVHILHSLHLCLSAVQVFYGSKMAVVAHSVGPDTIRENKRGMLIKGNDGDLGLLTAQWTGVMPTEKGIPGKRLGSPKNQGYCEINYKSIKDPQDQFHLRIQPDQ